MLMPRVASAQWLVSDSATSAALEPMQARRRNVVAEYLEGDSTYWRRTMGRLLLRPVRRTKADDESVDRYNHLAGRRVGSVRIIVLPPFATSVADTVVQADATLFERIGNRLRFPTLRSVIRSNMTLEPGGTVGEYSIYENERLLRGLNFVNDVSITPTLTADSSAVDLLVVVQDRLPHAVSGDFNTSRQRLSVYSRNVFGTGLTIGADLIDYKGDPGYRLWCGYTNIARRFVNASLSYYSADTTRHLSLEVQRLFQRSPYRLAGGLLVNRSFANLPDSYMTRYEWHRTYNFLYSNLWAGCRFGRGTMLDRPQLYVLMQHICFVVSPFGYEPDTLHSLDPALSDANSLFGAVALGRRTFVRKRLVYSAGRTEDIPLGHLILASGGVCFSQGDARPYFGFAASAARTLWHDGYIWAKLSAEVWPQRSNAGTRKGKGAAALDVQMFSPLLRLSHSSARFFLNAGYVRGFGRDSIESIGFRGMRQGKPFLDNSIRGTQKLFFSSEAVAFTPVSTAGFRLSFFTFADAGWISRSVRELMQTQNHYSCIGFGTRLRNDRLVFGTLQIKFGIALTHNSSNFVDVSSQSMPSFSDFAPSTAFLDVFK